MHSLDLIQSQTSSEVGAILLLNILKQKREKRGDPRYITFAPKSYLCMNEGQYAPWWNEHDFHWNRCKDKDGKNIDGKPDEPGMECECDDDCLTRQDCCTDYFKSCRNKGDYDWAETPCETGFDSPDPVTLLISTDGFRKSYLTERAQFLPNYLKLRKCGAAAQMQASYPTKTFPNHYSIVTGLHPSQHGIVDNDWFDWKRNASCSVFNDNSDADYPCAPMNEDEHWYGGDPIWNTVERHDKVAAACLWPGCELTINGQAPTYHWDYDKHGEGPFAERVYQILKWLQLPKWNGVDQAEKQKSRPDFMTMYVDEPDHMGHAFGPYDTTGEIDRAIKRVDVTLGMLMDGLKMYGLEHEVNIVLTSDHGMELGLCEEALEVIPPSAHLEDQIYVRAK